MEVTANALQVVGIDQNVLFTETAVSGNCSIMHREGSGIVTLRGMTNQCRARFRITFGANIAVPTGETVGPISLAIAVSGEAVPTSSMIETPAAVEEFSNVSSVLFLDVPRGCCTQVSVENTSTIPVNVQNANLIVERVA